VSAEDELLVALRDAGTIEPGGRYVVMLSGGRDSACLVHACVRIAGAATVTALHVNYGLRGAAADGDERHCEELCAALGIVLKVDHAPPPPAAGNLQAWARDHRYAVAGELAERRGARVLVGHTRDDQLETILYRLISSPTRRALSAMRERDGALLRPLLSHTRADTTAYCERNGLRWRDDASNDSDAYVRNRIRRELVPLLGELRPGAARNVLTLAERLRGEGEVLDELVDEALGGARTIALETLRALPPALARLVIQRLADQAADGIAPGAGAHAGAVVALGERGTTQVDIGCGLRAVSEYGTVRIERLGEDPTVPASVALAIPGEAAFADVVVRCEPAEPRPLPGVLDRATLGGPLTVRAWRPGDRIRPLGLEGSQSLQDLFQARRVPRARRASVPVVCAGEEIVWVGELAIAERCKVTAATRDAVRLSLTQR
jgi:tRNA(Ile)-lysidine synthase